MITLGHSNSPQPPQARFSLKFCECSKHPFEALAKHLALASPTRLACSTAKICTASIKGTWPPGQTAIMPIFGITTCPSKCALSSQTRLKLLTHILSQFSFTARAARINPELRVVRQVRYLLLWMKSRLTVYPQRAERAEVLA